MTISTFAKAIGYTVAALLMIGLSVWITGPMYTYNEIVTAYLRSVLLLFIAGCSLLGVGAYSYFAYAKRHADFRMDSLFLAIYGAVILLLAVITLCRFGGMSEGNFDKTSLAAVNLNVMIASALSLPFLVRTIVLSFGVPNKRQRTIALSAAAVAVAVFVALAIGGQLLHTIEFADIVSQNTNIQP